VDTLLCSKVVVFKGLQFNVEIFYRFAEVTKVRVAMNGGADLGSDIALGFRVYNTESLNASRGWNSRFRMNSDSEQLMEPPLPIVSNRNTASLSVNIYAFYYDTIFLSPSK